MCSLPETAAKVRSAVCSINHRLALWVLVSELTGEEQLRTLPTPDPNKQATEVVFSRRRKPDNHPALYFNDAPVTTAPFQKHLGLFLDKKLTFGHHLNEKISKANKGIGLIKRLYSYLPRKSLLNIYKSFIRPHLDYGDVIYDQPHNDTFCRMIESVQYNAALAITGAIKGSSRERLYQELGLESLSARRWYRRLVYFFNIISCNSPAYLHSLLPAKQRSYDPTRSDLFRTFTSHTNFFKNSFFPYCTSEWNKLGPNLRNSTSISKFKEGLLAFIRPKQLDQVNFELGTTFKGTNFCLVFHEGTPC